MTEVPPEPDDDPMSADPDAATNADSDGEATEAHRPDAPPAEGTGTPQDALPPE